MFRGVLTLAILAAPFANAAPCGGHGTRDTVFVSTAWLADHLKDRNLIVLAVGTEEEYQQGHIPGSQFFQYRDVQAASSGGSLTLQMPETPVLARNFEKYGVSNDSRIVLYRLNNAVTQTARVYVTLDAIGLARQTSLLDGNLAVWKTEGRATTADAPKVSAGKLEPCSQDDVIADLDYVKTHLSSSGVRIVDARAPEVYSGAQSRPPISAGHIQGASNIYFNSLFDDQGKLKPAAELQKLFAAAGVHTGDRVVTYCFIGQQASALYAVSRYLGYDTRLYDGSMEEWSRHPDLPVEKNQPR